MVRAGHGACDGLTAVLATCPTTGRARLLVHSVQHTVVAAVRWHRK